MHDPVALGRRTFLRRPSSTTSHFLSTWPSILSSSCFLLDSQPKQHHRSIFIQGEVSVKNVAHRLSPCGVCDPGRSCHQRAGNWIQQCSFASSFVQADVTLVCSFRLWPGHLQHLLPSIGKVSWSQAARGKLHSVLLDCMAW